MENPKISIVIPVWNEEKNIATLVRSFDKVLRHKAITYELIFVDDRSTDKTFKLAKSLSLKHPFISVYQKKGPRGKAYSLMEGSQKAKYDLICAIDGDLQYPPEAIPGMIMKIQGGADVVVADRLYQHVSKLRKILSANFRIIFGHFLFGLRHDIQAGLKIFKKEVIKVVKFEPSSGWTFDLEFLHRAREAGFKIQNYGINFHPRPKGNSKVDYLKTSLELGFHALKLKFKKIHPWHITPKAKDSMLGAGVRYRRQKYLTHTTLPHHQSALETLLGRQKIILILLVLLVLAGLIYEPLTAVSLLVAVLSFIYFVDFLFNFFLIVKSLNSSPEIHLTGKELSQIDESALPVYSVLCPLYQESKIIPQFLQAMDKLDWPKEKLDLILLLEEDDRETIEALNQVKLPFYARKVIVPYSLPKTKPKACNYGISVARGEYVVIYDAEDIPDPLQLKKAYLGFQKVNKDVACLQAKLNYYNPEQNLLTRLFTVEYSLWFNLTLTGLQALNTSIPLGGTSNHFRRRQLLNFQGWDPFNVTEDADLGVRLFKDGYKTAVIDSTTLEEANSKLPNWLKQRSRWIKGYMQTYLVHTRENFSFAKTKGLHSLIFQLVIGGKIAFILINPILWIITLSYFLLYSVVGPNIESLYPAPVFYMALVSLVFGNFLFAYYFMIAAIRKKQWSLVKYVYLVPIYWVLISVGGYIALYQLLFKPHYWEKTVHGFHLDRALTKIIPEIAIKTEPEGDLWFPITWGNRLFARFQDYWTAKSRSIPKFRGKFSLAFLKSRKEHTTGLILIGSLILANFLNFLFNTYLGRKVELSDFALINLVNGFLALTSIVFGAIGTTVNYRTGFLIGKFQDENYAYQFWQYIRRRTLPLAVVLTVVWFALSPLLAGYFRTDQIFLFVLFGLVILIRFAASTDRGFLSARFMFISLAALTIFEPVAKLTIAYLLLKVSLPNIAYSAIPLSVVGTFILGWFLVTRKPPPISEAPIEGEAKYFPKKFFWVALLSGLATVTFLNLDIVLAKHFLTSTEAGKYAFISLVGKMVYFLGSLSSPFLMPLVSRAEGSNKNSQRTFIYVLMSTTFLSFTGFVAFGIFGKITVPMLYGPKTLSILPYLIIFSFAMMCFTVSKVFTSYYLAKKVYSFSFGALFLSIIQFLLIYSYHSSVSSIVTVMAIVGALNLILMTTLHLNLKWVKIFENNFTSFSELFLREKETASFNQKQLKILIFNWRDIKHKWAGGAEVYIHELARRWVDMGHKVTLFCGNDGNSTRNEVINGVTIIRRGGFYMVYVWAFFYYMLRFRGKYDVIIDCENGIPFFTPLYAKEKIYLVLYHVHQAVFRKSLAKPMAILASFLEMELMPMVYRKIQFITISPSSKKDIIDHRLTRLEPIVVYSGVDIEKYRPSEKKHENPLILHLGRIKYYKSLNILIKAAKTVLTKIPDARFVIAGEGEERKNLIEFAKRLNLADKISFLGKVSEEEKIRLYQKAWVFVNPSMMEGWGITTIEANACGTPVIAANVPGLRDSVQNPHTGILVPWGNTNRLATSIIKIISYDDLRAQLTRNAIDWAKQFSWEKSAQAFLNAITNGLETKRERRHVEGIVFINTDRCGQTNG